jgi:hypothetical protein
MERREGSSDDDHERVLFELVDKYQQEHEQFVDFVARFGKDHHMGSPLEYLKRFKVFI